jgi:threonylcarbamoyladenosine tRNA methylthiotransferase MtaB
MRNVARHVLLNEGGDFFTSMFNRDKKNKISFQISTLGCKVNQYDSAVLKNLLLSGNFILPKKNQALDLIIINSCSVTSSAIIKTRRLLSSLKKKNPQAKIVLIGCWPKVYDIKDLKVDFVFSYKDLSDLAKNISKIFLNTKLTKDCSKLNLIDSRSRYFIKIQDGCQQFCSYCVIPLARGPLKSRSALEIIKEIKLAVDSGFSEIVLSGIHLGLYGRDFVDGQKNLYSLLLKVLKIENIGRIRLSSIEVTEISDDIIKLISKNRKMCRHLHIPLQSGNNKILKLMNRPYDVKFFEEKINKIRKNVPDIAITTDIIVGFPGEGVEDFKKTYEFAKKINFSKIHVFSFSAHEKTPAYFLPNRVGAGDIKKRSLKLRQLSIKLEKNYKKEILDDHPELEVIIEGSRGEKVRAKTEFYFDIIIPKKDFEKKYLGPGSKGKATPFIGKKIIYKS